MQNANADSSAHLRVFAYDLNYTFEPENEDTQLGTYTFSFTSNVQATSGAIILYDEQGKNIVGRYDLTNAEMNTRSSSSNYYYSVELTSAQLAELTNQKTGKTYLNMKWGVELRGEKIIGKDGVISALQNTSNYKLSEYATKGNGSYTFNTSGAIYKQVTEPIVEVLDENLQSPQGIAIDNNPQSPFFGRIYVANAPSATRPTNSSYGEGVLVYEYNPQNQRPTKLGGSYMPQDVTIPELSDNNNKRWFMHRIAVNPVNGEVFYCKSTSGYFSAIYKLSPDASKETPLRTETAINVTQTLIPESATTNDKIFTDSILHPIYSIAFDPYGDLYVMSRVGGESHIQSGGDTDTEDDDKYAPGTGKIYKLIDDEKDGIYDRYVQHYIPKEGQLYGTTNDKGETQYGFPYCISPWVDADNSMLVTSRGSFWVAQKRSKINAYSFLAHIHASGYEYRKKAGTGLASNFQYALGAGAQDTYSGNSIIPTWNTRLMLSPHTEDKRFTDHPAPSGQIAIYEKNGLMGDEALLAVGFKERVCIFKVFYNEGTDKNTWFGFNMDWMFEIPISGATIDGLAFDYAGNLFIASAATHKLYVCALPNYGAMQDVASNRPNPTEFHEGERTNQNNLNRGEPLDDNNVTTVVSDQLLISNLDNVDGAIVFDQKYNEEGFDTQWSTEENWNIQRIPGKTDIPVIIRSNANISNINQDGYSVSGLMLENGSHLTIAHDGGLTVGEGGITGAADDGSSITIQNYSSEYISNQGAGYLRIHPSVKEQDMPKVTVNYITKGRPDETDPLSNNDLHWQYMGAPGKGTNITITNHTWIYKWEDNQWKKKSGSFDLEPFEGYAITQKDMPSYTWTTTAINTSHDVTLEEKGNHIFANSYLAPIDVTAFTDYEDAENNPEDDFVGDVQKTFYLYNTGSWSDWRNAVNSDSDDKDTDGDGVKEGVQGQAAGQYTAIPVLSARNLTENTTIAPMQGVYVKTTGKGTIRLNYKKHVWDTEKPGTTPMRAPEKTHSPDLLRRIRIQAYGENSGSDRMYILQDMRCTPDYDNGYDGKNMNAAGQVNIYTNEPCGKMEISSTNQIDGMYIGFRAGPDTTYTLRFTSLIGDSLCIKDLANDSIIALYEDSTYTFYAAAKSVNNMRFQVVLHPNPADDYSDTDNNSGTTTDVDNVSTSQLWMADQHLCISNQKANSTAKIYSVSGQLLISEKFNYQIDIPVYNLTTGVYILEVNNERYKFIRQN